MARDTVITMVTGELERIGLPYRLERGRRHPKVVFQDAEGREVSHSFPGTHSDHRTIVNCRCSLRRRLRSLGLIS